MNRLSASVRHPLLRRGAAALAGMLCLLVAGCSITGFAYERLDWFARWQVGRYVTLTPAQRVQFDSGFAAVWQWHRNEVLPRWIDEMRALAANVGEPRSAAQFGEMADRYGGELRAVFERLMPLVCAIGPQLDDGQVAEILEAVDEDIVELREEEIEPEPAAVRKMALKNLEKTLRRNLGGLDPAQRKQLREWIAARPAVAPDWLDYRQRWRDRLAATLQRRGEAAFCGEIAALLFDGNTLWTDTQRAAFTNDRALWLQMLAALQPTLSPEQKQRLRERLRETADALAPLVPTAPATPAPAVNPVAAPPG